MNLEGSHRSSDEQTSLKVTILPIVPVIPIVSMLRDRSIGVPPLAPPEPPEMPMSSKNRRWRREQSEFSCQRSVRGTLDGGGWWVKVGLRQMGDYRKSLAGQRGGFHRKDSAGMPHPVGIGTESRKYLGRGATPASWSSPLRTSSVGNWRSSNTVMTCRVRRSATPLDRGTHVRLAGPLPPAASRTRSHDRRGRTDVHLCLTHIMLRRLTKSLQRSHENEHRLAHIA